MQYRQFTVNLTNGSTTVTGNLTKFLGNVVVGYSFKRKGENAVYQITAVNSDTSLSISPAYAGTTASEVEYQITTDYTVNLGLAEVNVGDVDWQYHLTQEVIRKLDEKLAFLSNCSVTYNSATQSIDIVVN